MTRIYTRTGDDGTTSLGSRERVNKDNQRVATYGDVDELNSMIGLALALEVDSRIAEMLTRVQNELFNLGTVLAYPYLINQKPKLPTITEEHISLLEADIDGLSAATGPLKNFILPGGSPSASALHVSRAICRRVERSIVTLSGIESVDEIVVRYINRLSDALFVMARYENMKKGADETIWES